MKIGIYGGTFNPPHIGHVFAASEAVEQLKLDKLLIIPTGQPPHKAVAENSPATESRLEMVRIAFSGIGCAEILDIEIRRQGKSYTADTVRELKKQYPDDEMILLMGTDMFNTLDMWYDARDIMDSVMPTVFERNCNERVAVEEKRKEYAQKYDVNSAVVNVSVCPVSSSQIRGQLPQRMGTEYLQPEVYAYILRNRLYGVKANFDYLRFSAYKMLNAKRMLHVAGCEQEAVRLAIRWGADVEEAREAAILHDITKKCDADEQLILCDKYGIITDTVEKNEYKLLHAKTGAAAAKDMFGVSDEVFNAINWHTTGKADMSLLEKIIYIADYIEPSRDFDGLSQLRKLAYENLDRALIMGIEMSIDDMHSRNIVPHKNSMEALEYLQKHTQLD